MKVLQVIKKIILTVLGVIFFAFAILMTVLLLNYNKKGLTQMDDTTLVIVKGEISSDNYKKGDLVLVESRKVKNVEVGDELFVYLLDNSGTVSIDVGIVEEVRLEANEVKFKNGETYGMDLAVGEATKVYHNIGTFLSIVTSTIGFLFIVIVPSFLMFIYQLYALVVEIKYGGKEEKEA